MLVPKKKFSFFLVQLFLSLGKRKKKVSCYKRPATEKSFQSLFFSCTKRKGF